MSHTTLYIKRGPRSKMVPLGTVDHNLHDYELHLLAAKINEIIKAKEAGTYPPVFGIIEHTDVPISTTEPVILTTPLDPTPQREPTPPSPSLTPPPEPPLDLSKSSDYLSRKLKR